MSQKALLGAPLRPFVALYLAEESSPDTVRDRMGRLGVEIRQWPLTRASLDPSGITPDLIVVHDSGVPGQALQAVQDIKRSVMSTTVPLVVVTRQAQLAADERRRLQELGTWSVHMQPIDGDAFEARLRTFLDMRREVAELHASSHVDQVTRLYNKRGLEALAASLASHCSRQGMLLSCVAFTLSAAESVRRSANLQASELTAVGNELLRVGRSSDIIGRAGAQEFVVLAPGASGSDARQLAQRLTRSIVTRLNADGIACDAPWVGRVLQPSRDAARLGEELLSDTLLALDEVTAEHEITAVT